MTQIDDLSLLILAARANPNDLSALGALADCLAEQGDPREKWLRGHMKLRAKLYRFLSSRKTKKTRKFAQRLDYTFGQEFSDAMNYFHARKK